MEEEPPLPEPPPVYQVGGSHLTDTIEEKPAPVEYTAPLPKQDKVEVAQAEEPRKFRIRVIGEIFFTYILAQIDETFAIIDKHAAHERILYNRLKENSEGLEKQYLLTSVVVTLSKAEHECILERQDMLGSVGLYGGGFWRKYRGTADDTGSGGKCQPERDVFGNSGFHG